MAAQDEREPGVVVMCSVLDPMVQDTPVQDIPIPEQDESLPQMDPEPEMGAAAAEAAVHDTSPPPLYQNPPTLAKSAQPVTVDMAQLFATLAGISGDIHGMKEEIKNNTQAFKSDMRALRGETRQVGQCLQADKMATPRAGSSELKGSECTGG